MNKSITELILVGLPGPMHNYSGLAHGNLAAQSHAGQESRPREAALQVIALMADMLKLGLCVGVLPPQPRPNFTLLRGAGFDGTPAQIIRAACEKDRALLARAYSSAAMWTANAATVTPGADAGDGQLHLTVANLVSHLHRAIEAEDTLRVLTHAFQGQGMAVHPPLEADMMQGLNNPLRDEGAANHMRLCPNHGAKGLNVFVHGDGEKGPRRYPARQTRAASEAIAGRHGIPDTQCLFLQQNPEAIDHGVFHNDVIAVANESVLLCHARAFAEGAAAMHRIREAYARLHPGKPPLTVIEVSEAELTVAEAVSTYLFNSQLVTLPDGGMALIAPLEARQHVRAEAAAHRITEDAGNPIRAVHYADVRQSMKNGGGPACLRLRVPMTGAQLAALRRNCALVASEDLLQTLEDWVMRHYRHRIVPADLGDPKLYNSAHAALAELADILGFPALAPY